MFTHVLGFRPRFVLHLLKFFRVRLHAFVFLYICRCIIGPDHSLFFLLILFSAT